jgi:hypothetical protein
MATDQNLRPAQLLGNLLVDDVPSPIRGATAYLASEANDGLLYIFTPGTLAGLQYLSADFLLDGVDAAAFLLRLQEGGGGPVFELAFGLLNQCQARMRLSLSAVDQNRWLLEREGAFLKPMCRGSRVDIVRVDRMTLTVLRKSEAPLRWWQTSIQATVAEPPRLTRPALPKGKLLDEMGQFTLRQWAGKSASPQEVTGRLLAQLADAPKHAFPQGFSRWGGWTARRFDATGFFRTHHDGRRWWLVDPDGHPFWSTGLDCVRPWIDANINGLESALTDPPDPNGPYAPMYAGRRGTADYLVANLIRAFGPERWREHWGTIALSLLRQTGFNTVANWSEWQIARRTFAYVRPLGTGALRTKMVYRDFPDVFDPAFAAAAAQYAAQLADTVDDPAFLGYFLMNEPTWGFTPETPAAGMLFNTEGGASRTALAAHLTQRYVSDEALAAAWGMPVTRAAVAAGRWTARLTPAAEKDLEQFSTLMVETLFHTLSEACRKVDPHHLNLGARYYTIPPRWALAGMTCFDVFSINCYAERILHEPIARIESQLRVPVLIGEWHFGALDVGLPASGIGRVANQADRGRAFRVYTEDAAADPRCVGVHYFTMYDQSALGRFDGENYNIGLWDICSRPYEPLTAAARASHERIYAVATGEVEPFNDAPQYLPKVFY